MYILCLIGKHPFLQPMSCLHVLNFVCHDPKHRPLVLLNIFLLHRFDQKEHFASETQQKSRLLVKHTYQQTKFKVNLNEDSFNSHVTGTLFLKLSLPNVRRNCSSDQEKLLKFEANGWESAKHLISQDQLIQTVSDLEGSNNFWNRMLFNLVLEVSQIYYIGTIIIQIGKINRDLEICSKS